MAIKDILVHLDGDSAIEARVRVATALAEQEQSHLLGLYTDPGVMMPPVMDVPLPATVLAELEEQAVLRRNEVKSRFEELVEKSNVSAEWRVAKGGAATSLAEQGRYADLVIAGQSDERSEHVIGGPASEAAVLSVGRPVLFVPYVGARTTLGRKVLVAWDAGQQAARAVNDALPLLQRAESVEVMYVNPPSSRSEASAVAGADISLHLARHGVTVNVNEFSGSGVSVGDVLLSRAADLDIDLIVMGAYGHSRLREFVFGGVTKHMLNHMTVPVFMSH